jgi:prolyl-tRNA editing enzyme YbaK/EbsC (Cys-tRNA(Pro) deacylase)
MSNPLTASAQRVQDVLDRFGCGHRVLELQRSTRSAAEAALAVGCSVGQIAKSMVFRAEKQYAEIWAAAGNPNAVFRLTPSELVKITGGRVVSVK